MGLYAIDKVLLIDIHNSYGIDVRTKTTKKEIEDKIVEYKEGKCGIEEVYRYFIPYIIRYAYSNIEEVTISESVSEFVDILPGIIDNFNLKSERNIISTVMYSLGCKVKGNNIFKNIHENISDDDDPYGPDPIEVIESKIISQEIETYLNKLNDEKRVILKMAYGIGCEKRDVYHIFRESKLETKKIQKIMKRFEQHLSKLITNE